MPALIIFTSSITNRIKYSARLLFGNLLGMDVQLTSSADEFLAFEGYKLNYSLEQFDAVPQVKPAKLLFEKRINDQNVSVKDGEMPLLFPNDGLLGFDPLAAAFYLVTRYEEYLPHRSDEHGRFPARESMAFKHGFLQFPLVEYYASVLADSLQIERTLSPELEVSYDIDQAYAFQHKGWLRTSLAFGQQALRLNGRGLRDRYKVLIGTGNDPLDIYNELLELTSAMPQKPLFFLQVGENTEFDINGPSYHHGFQQLVSTLEQGAIIGLHPSYYSSGDNALLTNEMLRLRSLTTTPILRSRQHFLRIQWPSTFTRLEEMGVMHDYSMGYSEVDGFRASISRPYKFYNLRRDEPSELVVHPFCLMDMVGLRMQESRQEQEERALELWRVVKEVGGRMCTVWHPESLIGLGFSRPTMPLLKSLIAAS